MLPLSWWAWDNLVKDYDHQSPATSASTTWTASMKQNYLIIITDISKIIGVLYSFRKFHVEEGVINGEIRLHA